ncbi:FHA domain-containing protein [Amycolatopsis sp. CA-128772]|uniref:FHA domain-containing protein n=1 Tax=Amycolatopsis sp. CA-128772 TaxID=2073159 RepID=UPI000CD04466|nr:FHA domain-containing protein [Amycolatopsis sp. CA-128772]
MAGVICPVCHTDNTDDEALCKTCGMLLAEAEEPRPAAAGEAAPEQPAGPAPARCPACGADVPDPANLVCVECLEPLSPPPEARGRPGGGALRLVFTGQAVDVPQPGSVLLGRDPGHSPVAALFSRHDNVSRRHASVGVGTDGRGWVRDEHSTNGTFVNNTRVPDGETAALVHGDRLRIASDVVAVVQFGPDGPS